MIVPRHQSFAYHDPIARKTGPDLLAAGTLLIYHLHDMSISILDLL